MILRQYLHTDPVIATSYRFGCGGHAAGAVVDPVSEPERYLEAAAAVGLRRKSGQRISACRCQ
jgi:hydroxyacylglutathione hydrolase